MSVLKRSLVGLCLLLAAPWSLAEEVDGELTVLVELAEVQAFIARMVQRHGMDAGELEGWFRNAALRPEVIKAISRPAEAKPWHEYRSIFLTESRIRGGLDFWREHAGVLQRAEQRYGVPAPIIVAIIGVETRYGRHRGRFPVIESLASLGFHYPPRADFFRRELEEFLLLCREEGLDPLATRGSYAGAMGLPQFISSSYRSYAVDFDADGRRDLLGSVEDAVGSVAAYLARHGWQPGRPIARQLAAGADPDEALLTGMKPTTTAARLRGAGLVLADDLAGAEPLALLGFEQSDGHEYWLGLRNFYVITRYNHSPLYAMAVYQLSEAIAGRYARSQ